MRDVRKRSNNGSRSFSFILIRRKFAEHTIGFLNSSGNNLYGSASNNFRAFIAKTMMMF